MNQQRLPGTIIQLRPLTTYLVDPNAAGALSLLSLLEYCCAVRTTLADYDVSSVDQNPLRTSTIYPVVMKRHDETTVFRYYAVRVGTSTRYAFIGGLQEYTT